MMIMIMMMINVQRIEFGTVVIDIQRRAQRIREKNLQN
jgi:hypothetical protein